MNATVLYIEDDAANVVLVGRLLKRRPQAELRVATNGRDGVAAAVDGQPALILLDNQLPDATGGEVLRQLTANPATAQIPVIMISGDSAGGTINELLANGAVDFLVKPYDINKFLTTIDKHLP